MPKEDTQLTPSKMLARRPHPNTPGDEAMRVVLTRILKLLIERGNKFQGGVGIATYQKRWPSLVDSPPNEGNHFRRLIKRLNKSPEMAAKSFNPNTWKIIAAGGKYWQRNSKGKGPPRLPPGEHRVKCSTYLGAGIEDILKAIAKELKLGGWGRVVDTLTIEEAKRLGLLDERGRLHVQSMGVEVEIRVKSHKDGKANLPNWEEIEVHSVTPNPLHNIAKPSLSDEANAKIQQIGKANEPCEIRWNYKGSESGGGYVAFTHSLSGKRGE